MSPFAPNVERGVTHQYQVQGEERGHSNTWLEGKWASLAGNISIFIAIWKIPIIWPSGELKVQQQAQRDTYKRVQSYSSIRQQEMAKYFPVFIQWLTIEPLSKSNTVLLRRSSKITEVDLCVLTRQQFPDILLSKNYAACHMCTAWCRPGRHRTAGTGPAAAERGLRAVCSREGQRSKGKDAPYSFMLSDVFASKLSYSYET